MIPVARWLAFSVTSAGRRAAVVSRAMQGVGILLGIPERTWYPRRLSKKACGGRFLGAEGVRGVPTVSRSREGTTDLGGYAIEPRAVTGLKVGRIVSDRGFRVSEKCLSLALVLQTIQQEGEIK